jgi:cobalt-zinc-cadmium efflux system membrane fusion protein
MKQIFRLIIIYSIICSCSHKAAIEEKTTESSKQNIVSLSPEQVKSVDISVQKLSNHNISSLIRVNGIIDVPPQNTVSVCMPLGGYLESTTLLPGMPVTKGEVIGIIQDQQYIQLQQDYLTVKSKLGFTELEYNRQKDLNQNKASSDKIFQQIEMEFNNQKIALSALAEKLKLIHLDPKKLTDKTLTKSINIYSPITGFVSKVNVNPGRFINPADVLFELINPDDIHLNLKVFEKDVDKLFIGQKLNAFNNNTPEKKFPCEIILISKDLTSERFVEVHCHFKNYDKSLLPGMYMNADIKVNNSDKPSIPDEALVNFEGATYLFIASTNKSTFEMQKVDLGSHENGFTEVLNSDKFKDKDIVIKGSYTLLMKLKNKEE